MRAASWRFATMAFSAVIQLAVGIVLAWLLLPSDFGLIALAAVFIGFGMLLANLGIPNAVVQANDLNERHIRAAFTISVTLGIAVAGVIWLGAPLSTLVFDEPRLPEVLRVLSILLVIGGFSNTAGALVRRELDFRTLFYVNVVSYLFGHAAVAIGMAILGYGVWSLVGGRIALVVIQAMLLLWWVRHPARPILARRESRQLLGFGTGNALSSLLHFLAQSGDKFVIGRFLGGAGPLGLYNRAYQQMRLASDNVGQLFVSVMFPTFAQLQNDRRRFGIAFLRSIELATLLTAPLMAGMIVAAPHLIVGVYGPQWEGSVRPFQVLALGGVLATVYPIVTVSAEALGRVYAVSLRNGVFATAVVILGIAASPWGITGVGGAVVCSYGLVYILMASLALRSVGISRRAFIRAHVPGTAVALVVAAAGLATRFGLEALQLPHLVILVALIGTSAATMWAAVRWLPRSLRPDQLLSQIRSNAPRLPPAFDRLLEILLGNGGDPDEVTD
jgi:O-antigen/teichoic acid export membrane protein